MKRIFLICGLLVATLCSWAQQTGEVKLTVNKQYGETINFWITPTEKTDNNVRVDWGDEDIKSYTIDPDKSDYYKKVSAPYQGGENDTIRIYGNFKKLDCNNQGITSVTLVNQPQMIQLNANKNEISSENCMLDGAPNLTNLDLSANQLVLLDVRNLKSLEFLTAYNNPQLTTVMFSPYGEDEDGNEIPPAPFESIKQISLSNCDISNFYPVSMPNLTSLNLSNNVLMDLKLDDYYPQLSSLNISGNYISTLDVAKCPKLSQLNVSDNQFTEVNVSQNTELVGLYCSNNQIEELNLVNNPQISNLSCSSNKLTKLDVSMLPKLTDLTCDSNKIARLNFSKNPYLNKVYCKANELEFLDFAGHNMNFIDCRGNEKMTACALNYMFSTLLGRYEDAYYPNLLVEGCQWETADMSEVNSSDMKWKTDVVGDGTADCGEVAITVLPSENGTFHLEQPTEYGQNYKKITDKAVAGTPIKVVAVPDEDFTFRSVSVNGVAVADTFFIVHEDSEIAVNFRSTLRPYITLNVAEAGQELQISLAASEDNTEITIDAGDGVEKTEIINKAPHYVDITTAGTTVKISGEVTYINMASLPPFGHDNEIIGLDVSHNDRLEYIDAFMNFIGTLSVENCPELKHLDCAYCELTSLNVGNNPKLTNLICYGNELTTLDVSRLTELEELDVRGNQLTAIDVNANKKLLSLNVHNNRLTTLDVTGLPELLMLEASINKLTDIDLTKNPNLWSLAVSDNQLTTLDVSKLPQLARLLCANNKLTALDLSAQEVMYYIECSNNGMSACAVNDFYFSLPRYEKPESDRPSVGETFSLWIQRSSDATPNDAEHAEHSMATAKGWTVNQDGDGSGCDEVYVTARATENGTVSLHNGDITLPATGGKVARGATINVTAHPEAGYELSSLRANGVNILGTNTFTAERYTEVVARFALEGSGVDGVEYRIELISGKGGLFVVADTEAQVEIYTTNGMLLRKQNVASREKIDLPAGMYIVKVEAEGKRLSEAVVVY